MTMEALENPKSYLEAIFQIQLESGIKTNLSNNDSKRLIREILCPTFDIFPSSSFDVELKNITFNRLLKEQKALINYLVEQKSAVINGAAGTGKTMIAVEKATRHAIDGDKVLFLCYNAFLRDHLKKKYNNDNIDYMTLDGFACNICKTQKADYDRACNKVIDMYLTKTFPYKHVIVDEGQDFGKEEIEATNLLQVIHDTVVDNDDIEGTFYIFYDKLQLIQSSSIPNYIVDADCKLTLYKNCRNTENIALTSLKPITARMPKLYEGSVKGIPATICFCDDVNSVVKRISYTIEEFRNNGLTDIVILTCSTEEKSVLGPHVTEGKYKKKLFTTCRKFKGLEADAIILIDVDEETFEEENVLRYYVGASRAKIRLEIISMMDDDACKKVLQEAMHYTKKIKKPRRELAYALNALPSIVVN